MYAWLPLLWHHVASWLPLMWYQACDTCPIQRFPVNPADIQAVAPPAFAAAYAAALQWLR